MPRILRCFPRYLLVLALATAAASVATHYLFGTSYAGATDDAAVRAGVEVYGSFLRSLLGISMGLLALGILCLGCVSSGLLAIPWLSKTGPWGWARLVALAMLVATTWLGGEAHRHPGFFLPLVSSGGWAPVWVGVSSVLWPVLLAASLMGWLWALRGEGSPRERVIGATLAAGIVAWLAAFEIPTQERVAGAPLRVGVPSARAGPTRARGRYPNILLIGVDSLRPDKIDEHHTPALFQLVNESTYYPNALVTLPRTAPSWVALLSSLPPLENGVETMFPSAARSDVSKICMPAHLASLGYATAVASEYAGEFFGRVNTGFQTVGVPRVELREMLGQGLLARHPFALGFAGEIYAEGARMRALLPGSMRDLLRGLASFSHPAVLGEDLMGRLEAGRHESPWFTLLFYSQPHFPYTSSSPYYARYHAEGSDPALRFGKDMTRGEVRTAADRRQVEGLYRAALAETDAAVGDLLARLRSSGELDDTIIVLTADHGEGLYECEDCVGHGDNLRGMMTLRVPLAFRLPRERYPQSAPRLVSEYVSQLDVYPTLLSLLGVARPPIQEGAPLLSRDGGTEPPPSGRTFFAETGEWLWPTAAIPRDRLRYPAITGLAALEKDRIVIEEQYLPVIRAAKHRAALRPPYKLVYRPGPEAIGYGLYDIERDPLEEHDLSSMNPAVFAELKDALRRSVLRFPSMIAQGDYFLTRPPSPPEEYW